MGGAENSVWYLKDRRNCSCVYNSSEQSKAKIKVWDTRWVGVLYDRGAESGCDLGGVVVAKTPLEGYELKWTLSQVS